MDGAGPMPERRLRRALILSTMRSGRQRRRNARITTNPEARMRIRTLLIGITAFVVLLVSVAAIADTTTASPATTPAVASASTDTGPAPAAARDASRYDVHGTPEMTRHSHIEYALSFVSTVYSLLVLLFLLATGISARMRDLATRIVRRPFL